MSDNIVNVEFKPAHLVENDLVQQIKDLVYSYDGRMSVAAAFGCIEIARHDLGKELLV